MESVKVSVIIPVYNMERYISEAIESIEKQTLKELEIVCVDDGSSDNSYRVMEEYTKKFSNILLLKQENQGPGPARNFGIKEAKGEFCCFLDADDFYYSDDILEKLYCRAKEQNVNLCGGSSCDYTDGIISTKSVRAERQFKGSFFIESTDYPGMNGFCAFLFRRMFLIENNIFFPSYYRGEDAPFFVRAIACAGGAYCCEDLVYVYRKNHKKVIYDENKSLDIAKGMRDIYSTSLEKNMKKVQHVVRQELNGQIGAMIYKWAYNGSAEMKMIINEFNSLSQKDLYLKDLNKNGCILLHGEMLDEYMNGNLRAEEEFVSLLKSKKKVFLYGAGMMGRKVKKYLDEKNVEIEAFLVSNMNGNSDAFEGLVIKSVEDISFNFIDDYIIIICTFWFTQKEIEKTLETKGIKNYYSIDLRRFFLWQDQIEH